LKRSQQAGILSLFRESFGGLIFFLFRVQKSKGKKMSIVAAAAAAAASASRRAAASAAAASSSSLRAALLNVASIDVPANVSVTRKGSELTVTGPLGTSKTDLASLDGRGDGALKLSPDGRSIEVASVSKPFFGTLQSLLKNKIEVRRLRRMIGQ
jgi:hypothetical protein